MADDEVIEEPCGGLDCGACGATIPPQRRDGLYEAGEEIRCDACGGRNQIDVQFDVDDDDETDVRAYVSHWWCVHGKDDESPCDACDAAEACA